MTAVRRRPSALVLVAAALGTTFLVLPVIGLVRQAPWARLGTILTEPAATAALRLSLVCSLAAAALAVVLGLPLAWALAHVPMRGRALLRGFVLLPMVLPPVVGGVALLSAFGRQGIVGGPLYDHLGVQLTFTTAGAILAETFVALPFFVITVEAGLRSIDPRHAEAATTLGASPAYVFRRVTLPLVAPSLLAGTALAWARAIGEFGATITFAGNVEGRTQTLPLAVYLELQNDPDTAVALSVVLLGLSLAVLALLRDRWLMSS